jgi:hypothetical protein
MNLINTVNKLDSHTLEVLAKSASSLLVKLIAILKSIVKFYGERNSDTFYPHNLHDLDFEVEVLAGVVPLNHDRIIRHTHHTESLKVEYYHNTCKKSRAGITRSRMRVYSIIF